MDSNASNCPLHWESVQGAQIVFVHDIEPELLYVNLIIIYLLLANCFFPNLERMTVHITRAWFTVRYARSMIIELAVADECFIVELMVSLVSQKLV